MVNGGQRVFVNTSFFVAEYETHRAGQRQVEQWDGGGGQLDGDGGEPGRGRSGECFLGVFRGDGLDQPFAAEGGLGHLGVGDGQRRRGEPDGLHLVRGGGAEDRADVVRVLDAVENHRQPQIGLAAPVSVQALQLGWPERFVGGHRCPSWAGVGD